MAERRLARLFAPRAIALAGASAREGSIGHAVLKNLRDAGFPGKIYAVNPRHAEVDGLECFPSFHDLPAVPDLAVVCAPKEHVPELVEDAAAKGAPVAIVITADPDHGENSLAAKLREIARRTGIRIVGPNCLGVMSLRTKLNASFAAAAAPAGDLAIISQSGAVAAGLIDWARAHHLGLSGLVSVGDMSDVNFADLLDHFALDASTRAIVLYIESITDAKRFLSAARAAARVKPVIVVKSGRHYEAAKAAATHTGAWAGRAAVYEAAFRRAGLLRVNGLDEVFAAAETLGRVRPFNGKRLAILTNGGGLGVLAVDGLLDLGGETAKLAPETIEKLNAKLPSNWSKSNPIDIVGDADPQRFTDSLTETLADKGVDAVLAMHCPTALSTGAGAAEAVAKAVAAHRSKTLNAKPVFAVWFGGTPEIDEIFEKARIPHFATEADALRGFMQMVRWRESRDALMRTPPDLPTDFKPDPARARRAIRQAISEGRQWLDQLEIVEVLDAYGVECASSVLATTPQEAAAAGRAYLITNGAVAVKIASRDITHKSDIGAVKLDLRTPEAVEEAARDILTRIPKLRPNAHIEGVTVHPMIVRPHGRELIAGIGDDPVFGPVVIFGRGGKAVERIADTALALPPLDLDLAHSLIARTRVRRVLDAYRDVPAADMDQIALTLVKLSQISADLPEIRELDLNPLVADETGVISLDARIQVAPAALDKGSGVNERFSIMPYPKNWERHVDLRDGRRVFVRPVRPEDEPMYVRFFETISAEDLRLRFFAPVREFSHAFIARLTQVDYARAFVLVAIEEETGEMLGEVRLMRDVDRPVGEYAVILRGDLKGQGLGWALMTFMIAHAEEVGLHEVEGQVLDENVTMLGMCANLGFKISADPDEPGVRLVKLDLDRPMDEVLADTPAATRPERSAA
jgi:acetyltransferase